MKTNSFSQSAYLSIIQLAKKRGYTIAPIKDGLQIKTYRSPTLLLRHDVDLHLEAALAMAKLEKKLGIRSTYFILLYNNFYNPLSPEGKVIVRQIFSFGHEIGIHWDSRDYQKNANHRFKRDVEILSEIVGKKIVSASQHEPTSSPLMKPPADLKFEAYRDFKDFVYVSDSSMKWRNFTPWKLIEKKHNIQFLAHPFWWMINGKTMREKFHHFHSHLSKKNKESLTIHLTKLNHLLKNRKVRDNYFGFKNKQVDL